MNNLRSNTTFLQDLPERLRSHIERIVGEEEEILWVAQPIPWAYGMQHKSHLWKGLLVVVIAALVMAGIYTNKLDVLQQHFNNILAAGIMSLIAGLCVFAHPFREICTARKVAYALTTKRAIKVTDGKRESVVWCPLPLLINRVLQQNEDGSGNLLFENVFLLNNEDISQGHPPYLLKGEFRFCAISNISELDNLLNEIPDDDD
ncbi:MAG: hypothetical protein KDA65_15565 [Planctomycetaceae bacterium]|nr:hypothetical protein [Planctomycetaceae bacterium]